MPRVVRGFCGHIACAMRPDISTNIALMFVLGIKLAGEQSAREKVEQNFFFLRHGELSLHADEAEEFGSIFA